MNKTTMTDNEAVSKGIVPITVCIFSVPMLLDSIFLWITALMLWFSCTKAGDTYVSAYAFLSLPFWLLVHHVFVIGGVLVKLVSEKKWFGNIGLWLCLISILHVIIRAIPFAMVHIAVVGVSV